jgi:hypothetical protein
VFAAALVMMENNELLVEQLGEMGEMIRIQDGGKRVVLNAS